MRLLMPERNRRGDAADTAVALGAFTLAVGLVWAIGVAVDRESRGAASVVALVLLALVGFSQLLAGLAIYRTQATAAVRVAFVSSCVLAGLLVWACLGLLASAVGDAKSGFVVMILLGILGAFLIVVTMQLRALRKLLATQNNDSRQDPTDGDPST